MCQTEALPPRKSIAVGHDDLLEPRRMFRGRMSLKTTCLHSFSVASTGPLRETNLRVCGTVLVLLNMVRKGESFQLIVLPNAPVPGEGGSNFKV